MAKLTDEMKEFIKGKLGYIATASPDGIPNIGPKGSFRVLDDEHLSWNEMTGKNTYENLLKNPNVAIAVVERETRQGYRFVGKAELLSSGPVYELAKDEMVKLGFHAPKVIAKVAINEIYNIGFPNWQKLA